MKFMAMVWPAFFACVKPVSTIAKPACMNMTRKPVTSVHTKFMAMRLWPTLSANLTASGSTFPSFVMSSAVGELGASPIASAATPVFTPEGSGWGSAAAGAGAGAAAGAVAAAGAAVVAPPIAGAVAGLSSENAAVASATIMASPNIIGMYFLNVFFTFVSFVLVFFKPLPFWEKGNTKNFCPYGMLISSCVVKVGWPPVAFLAYTS